MVKLTEAQMEMASRLLREVRLFTEHGDSITLSDVNADTLADIIAEFVRAALAASEERDNG